MVFVIFNDSGIEVFINDQWVAEVFVDGVYTKHLAEQWVKAANKVAEGLPKMHWRDIRTVVKANIVFDYN